MSRLWSVGGQFFDFGSDQLEELKWPSESLLQSDLPLPYYSFISLCDGVGIGGFCKTLDYVQFHCSLKFKKEKDRGYGK